MASNLEEGVATWYQTQFYQWEFGNLPDIPAPYLGALEAVAELFEHSDKSHLVIRELRKKSLSFSGIEVSDILAASPTLDPRTADFLVRQWHPWSTRSTLT